jgi:hypothetical protein
MEHHCAMGRQQRIAMQISLSGVVAMLLGFVWTAS